jgi:hypothetical protein
MQDVQEVNPQPTPQADLMQTRLKAEHQLRSGTNWFWWIAGLSIVNSLIILSGSNWNFVVGLGMTQIVDGVAQALAEEFVDVGTIVKVAGLLIDIAIAGLFVLLGFLARKHFAWAFIIGMVLYGLDSLIFLLVQSWLNVGFHAFALFGIYSGLKALKTLKTQAQTQPFVV